MLFSDYLSKTEARGSAGPIEFTSKKIRSAGVTGFIINLLTGQFSHLDAPDAIQVFAGSDLIVRCSAAQLRAKIRRLSKSSYDIPDDATSFVIPFYTLDMPANWPDPGPIDENGNSLRKSGDLFLRYQSQFPGKLEPQVVLTTSDAGGIEAELGWEYTDEAALVYPRFISQAHGLREEQTGDVYDITQPGSFRGFVFPTDKLLQIELHVNGSRRFKYSVGGFLASQQYESAPVAADDEIYFKIHGPEIVGKGTKVEVKTDTGFDESGQICMETILDQP